MKLLILVGAILGVCVLNSLVSCSAEDVDEYTLHCTIILQRIDAGENDKELPLGGHMVSVKVPTILSELAADDYERAAVVLLQSARRMRQRRKIAENTTPPQVETVKEKPK